MQVKKVLIVDDEPAIIEILTARLKSLGYLICAAVDGLEGVGKAVLEKPDLIIMDVLMPRMTGYEAMKKIREVPELQNIPAIVISARGSMKEFFMEIPGVEFLTKPYDPKELVHRIEALIGVSGAAPEKKISKSVILVGVEDLVLAKVRTLLETLGIQVVPALNEEDAFRQAKKQRPAAILCQFWEVEHILDPKKIAKQLAEDATIAQLPLYVFCKSANSMEAMKHFKGDRLITYSDNSDLLKKLEPTFSKIAAS